MEVIFGIFLTFLIFILIISLSTTILVIAGQWKMFKKANKEGWEALIPIYNIYVLMQISRTPIWMLLLFLIPGANFVVMVIVCVNLTGAFNKPIEFCLLLVFLPFIGYPILGFGDSKYVY